MNAVLTDEEYLRYDPFDGERDVDIKCREVRIVKVKKPHKCHGLDPEKHGHEIQAGERARYEKALVDGAWGSYYICLECLAPFALECLGRSPTGDNCS